EAASQDEEAADEDVDDKRDASAFETIPDSREFKSGSSGATVHQDAATIVAGDMRLEVRPNSLKEPQVVQIATKTPENLNLSLPAGLLVGAASGSPRDVGFIPVARWYIPLMYTMEGGTEL